MDFRKMWNNDGPAKRLSVCNGAPKCLACVFFVAASVSVSFGEEFRTVDDYLAAVRAEPRLKINMECFYEEYLAGVSNLTLFPVFAGPKKPRTFLVDEFDPSEFPGWRFCRWNVDPLSMYSGQPIRDNGFSVGAAIDKKFSHLSDRLHVEPDFFKNRKITDADPFQGWLDKRPTYVLTADEILEFFEAFELAGKPHRPTQYEQWRYKKDFRQAYPRIRFQHDKPFATKALPQIPVNKAVLIKGENGDLEIGFLYYWSGDEIVVDDFPPGIHFEDIVPFVEAALEGFEKAICSAIDEGNPAYALLLIQIHKHTFGETLSEPADIHQQKELAKQLLEKTEYTIQDIGILQARNAYRMGEGCWRGVLGALAAAAEEKAGIEPAVAAVPQNLP